jgi:hypothetical protein
LCGPNPGRAGTARAFATVTRGRNRDSGWDLENRLKVLNYGLNGRRYVDADHISRALMYLVTDDDGVISGQVMDVALGGSATGIH